MSLIDDEDDNVQKAKDELFYNLMPVIPSIIHDVASSFYKGGLKEGSEASQRYIPVLSDASVQAVVKGAGYLFKGKEESYKVYD